jgi:RNA polymerase sigma factor (sigma-70 family)
MDNGASSYHRFLEGDSSALEEIVELYNKKLILFLNTFVNNLAVAEDLAADTFLELILKKPRFNQESSFKTYLFKIGRNNALDHLKKQARHPSVPLDDMQLSEQDLFVDEIIGDEQRKELLGAIERLHPDYRDILHLLYFEDLSYSDAAAVMKKNVKQINNLAYRAKNALKAALEQEVT